MTEQFSVDVNQMRVRAPEFDRIGGDVAAIVQRLRNELAAEGAPWGRDDAGRAFAKIYLPESQQTMSDLDSLVQVLQQSGSDLRQLANNFEDQDLTSGQLVRYAADGIQNGSMLLPTTGVVTVPERSASSTALPNSEQPRAGSTAPTETTSASSTQRSPTAATAPVDPQLSADRAPTAEQRPGRSDRAQPGDVQLGTDQDCAPAASVNSARQADVAGSRPPQDIRTSPPPTGALAGKMQVARAAMSTPWSKPGTGRRPQVFPPRQGPSGSPPRMPTKPAARVQNKAERPRRNTAEPRADRSGESVAARLARELMDRHNVQAFGFDTPDAPEAMLAEIVHVVDYVLSRYPRIDLRAIGIAELEYGELTRLESAAIRPTSPGGTAGSEGMAHVFGDPHGDPSERALPAPRIVLAKAAAIDPERLQRAVAAAVDVGLLAPGCDQRPVYSSIVRGLGGALDVAGGFSARDAAHRTLLTAYAHRRPPEQDGSLHRAVSGFREWCAQLCSRSFRNGCFDPAAALAEAFTEVVLNGTQATEPAQVLHGLLVGKAEPAQPAPGGARAPS